MKMPDLAKVSRITWTFRLPESYGRYLTTRYADQFPDAVRVFLRTAREARPQNWEADMRITGTESWRTTITLEPEDVRVLYAMQERHGSAKWSQALMLEVKEDAERSGVILEYDKRKKRGGGF